MKINDQRIEWILLSFAFVLCVIAVVLVLSGCSSPKSPEAFNYDVCPNCGSHYVHPNISFNPEKRWWSCAECQVEWEYGPNKVERFSLPAKALTFPPTEGDHLILAVEAVDGDTIKMFWLVEDRARLIGINSPEPRGATKKAGIEATAHLKSLLSTKPMAVKVSGRDKYGRALIELMDDNGDSVNRKMIESGHARPWDGKGVKP